MNDLTSNLAYESHSLAHSGQRLNMWEKLGLALVGLGLLLMAVALFTFSPDLDSNIRLAWMIVAWTAIGGGGLLFGLVKHLRDKPGIRNHYKTTQGLTARGAFGWTLGIVLTGFYVLLYWYPETLEGLIRLHDPMSQTLRGQPANEWFVYGAFYTLAIWVMGVKALAKYRDSAYHIVRTLVIMAVQMGFAFLLPAIFERLDQPGVFLSYLWPLAHEVLFPSSVEAWLELGNTGYFFIGWFLVGTLLATPLLTYYFGKRWYCSWVCGCGGLANTAGDSFRQLSDKSLTAWKIERWMIHGVLVWIVLLTALLWFAPRLPEMFHGPLHTVQSWYMFIIGAAFMGVIGVGMYPLMGTRVWCRFGCPMAAVLGLLQKWCSRFRITTNGGQCISCGNCSKYCEMGIDVRWYAQRGQNVIRASCVGCGLCSSVCPRGVLSLENGPQPGRYNTEAGLSQLGKRKAR